jgi:hypothetical protein
MVAKKTSAAKKYDFSWTFHSGSERIDVLLNNPEGWVVFVKYNDFKPHLCKFLSSLK